METLPQKQLLSLMEASSYVEATCEVSAEQARFAIIDAARSGKIIAKGQLPLSAHSNPKIRESHPAMRECDLNGSDWAAQIDWAKSVIGRYRHVQIDYHALEIHFQPSESGSELSERKQSELPTEIDKFHSGLAGRPTAKHVIIAKHKERLEKGIALPTKSGEARYLFAWYGEEYPDGIPVSVTTIRTALCV